MSKTYHIDAEIVSLDDLQKRLEATDLVPSRASLINELESTIKILKEHTIQTLADLRAEMKTKIKLEALSVTTGIDKQYLVLFRREIESYFPKPHPLKKFTWFPYEEIQKLELKGIRNTTVFYKTYVNAENKEEFVRSSEVKSEIIEELIQLCGLTRMQWTSPLAAKMLFDAGYKNVEKVAKAEPEELYNSLVQINEGYKYFKGKIGLRDIKRLIHSAKYVLR